MSRRDGRDDDHCETDRYNRAKPAGIFKYDPGRGDENFEEGRQAVADAGFFSASAVLALRVFRNTRMRVLWCILVLRCRSKRERSPFRPDIVPHLPD